MTTEKKFCPTCGKETDIELVKKPDVDLKICTVCGSAVSILYKDT